MQYHQILTLTALLVWMFVFMSTILLKFEHLFIYLHRPILIDFANAVLGEKSVLDSSIFK